MTPYRTQVTRYGSTILQAGHIEDWNVLDIAKIRVATLDSMQGDEAELLIL